MWTVGIDPQWRRSTARHVIYGYLVEWFISVHLFYPATALLHIGRHSCSTSSSLSLVYSTRWDLLSRFLQLTVCTCASEVSSGAFESLCLGLYTSNINGMYRTRTIVHMEMSRIIGFSSMLSITSMWVKCLLGCELITKLIIHLAWWIYIRTFNVRIPVQFQTHGTDSPLCILRSPKHKLCQVSCVVVNAAAKIQWNWDEVRK